MRPSTDLAISHDLDDIGINGTRPRERKISTQRPVGSPGGVGIAELEMHWQFNLGGHKSTVVCGRGKLRAVWLESKGMIADQKEGLPAKRPGTRKLPLDRTVNSRQMAYAESDKPASGSRLARRKGRRSGERDPGRA